MATIKYFTKPDSAKRKTFFDDIEKLSEFSKINFHSMSDTEIKKFIKDYPHLLIRDITTIPFQDFAKIYQRYDKLMETEAGFQKVRTSLSSVQNTLLEKISEVKYSLEKTESDKLLSFTGTVTISFDSETKKYVEIYMPEGFDPDSEISTEQECKIITVKYFEIIAYLCQELPADRFKVCEKCGTPFFQATAREKLFCSAKCSKAVAQAQYMERKTQGSDIKINK